MKKSEKDTILRLEIATTSDEITYTYNIYDVNNINDNIDYFKNDTNIKIKEEKYYLGKNVIDFNLNGIKAILICVFPNNEMHKASSNKNKLGYIIRYSTSEGTNEYQNYMTSDGKGGELNYNLIMKDEKLFINIVIPVIMIKQNDNYVIDDGKYIVKIYKNKNNDFVNNSIALNEDELENVFYYNNFNKNYYESIDIPFLKNQNNYISINYISSKDEILSYNNFNPSNEEPFDPKNIIEIKDKYSNKITSDRIIFKVVDFNKKYLIIKTTPNNNNNYVAFKLYYYDEYNNNNNKPFLTTKNFGMNLALINKNIYNNKNILAIFVCNNNLCEFNIDLYLSDTIDDINIGETFEIPIISKDMTNIKINIINNNNNNINVIAKSSLNKINKMNYKNTIAKFNQDLSISYMKIVNDNSNKYEVNLDVIEGDSILFSTRYEEDDYSIKSISSNTVPIYGILSKEFECFKINFQKVSYLNFISNEYVNITFEIDNKIYSSGNITNLGRIFNETINKICINKVSNNNEIVYMFQLLDISNEQSSYSKTIISPLNYNKKYKHSSYNNTIRFFKLGNINLNKIGKKYILNYNILKDPTCLMEVYFDYCENYPKCSYNMEIISYKKKSESENINFTSIYDIQRFFTYRHEISYNNNYYRQQGDFVLITVCKSILCSWEISMNENDFVMEFNEQNPVSKYIEKNEVDKYILKYNDIKGESIIISLMKFSGESEIKLNGLKNIYTNNNLNNNNNNNCNIKQLNLGNIQTIEIPKNNECLSPNKNIDISITSITSSSIYSLSLQNINDNFDLTIYESNTIYIDYIENSKSKTIKFWHRFSSLKIAYITTFIPINCNIKTSFEEDDKLIKYSKQNKIIKYIFTPEMIEYKKDIMTYKINFESFDGTNSFKDQKCMFYTYSEELNNNNIFVLPQQISFYLSLIKNQNNYKILVPVSNQKNSIYVRVNFEQEILLNAKVYAGSEESEIHTFAKTKEIELSQGNVDRGCNDGNLCYILVDISLEKDSFKEDNNIIEILTKTSEKIPTFIKKNLIKQDFINCFYQQYYITELGTNEEGEISLNFKRGSGELMVRIVDKNIKTKEKNANWNLYELPFNDHVNNIKSKDLLNFDEFMNEVHYTKKDTEKCGNGCYLLIGVQSRDYYGKNYQDIFVEDYSIFIRNFNDNDDNDIVSVPLGEYINGGLSNNNKYDYYSIDINVDTNHLIMEFQSSFSFLYILIQKQTDKIKKPSSQSKTISIDSNENKIFYNITNEIYKAIPNNFKGYRIVIAVGSKNNNIELYLLRFQSTNIKLPQLIYADSDMQTYCINNINNICYFIIPLSFYDKISDLIIYAESKDLNEEIEIYASLVDINRFESSNENLYKLLPNKNSEFVSYKNFNKNYVYINYSSLKTNKYILIGVYNPIQTLVTLMTSFKTYIKQAIINPQTKTVFKLKNKEILNIDFPIFNDNNNIYNVLYLTAIEGEGYVYLEEENKILISGEHETFISELKNKNKLNIVCNGKYFYFYVWYKYNNNINNINEIDFGTSSLINEYKNFPFHYYVKINENFDINFNLKFKNIKKYDLNLNKFTIEGYIINEDELNEIKNNNNNVLNDLFKFNGFYEFTIQSFKLIITKEEIKKYITKNKQNYLYVIINTSSNKIKNNNLFQNEIIIIPNNNPSFSIPSNKYINSNLYNNKNINTYGITMKNNNDTAIRIIFIPSNKNNINWAVNVYDKDKTNEDYMIKGVQCNSYEFGGNYIIDLINDPNKNYVFSVFNNNNNNYLSYSFKYLTNKGEYFNNYSYYLNEQGKFEYYYNSNKKKLTIALPIIKKTIINNNNNIQIKLNINYYIKIYDNYSTSLEFSNEEPIYFFKYEINSNDYSNYSIKEINIKNMKNNRNFYLVLTGETEDNEIITFNTYNPYKNKGEPITEENKEDSKKRNKFLRIIIILVIIIIIVIIFILVGLKITKNKDNILNKINNISFLDENNNEDKNYKINYNNMSGAIND